MMVKTPKPTSVTTHATRARPGSPSRCQLSAISTAAETKLSSTPMAMMYPAGHSRRSRVSTFTQSAHHLRSPSSNAEGPVRNVPQRVHASCT